MTIKAGRAITGAVLAGVLCVVCVEAACSRQQLGVPRDAVSRVSPDRRYRALVRNHPSIDPPEQSLWLEAGDGGAASQIQKLSGDQDWCNVIEWAGDSRAVAFLVQDARLILVESAARQVRIDRWLVAQDGYPPTQAVSELVLSRDGSSVRFRACRRATGTCVDRVEMLHDK